MHDDKVACMLPWMHLHIWPNGDAFPCCVSDSNQPVGNINRQPMREIMDSQGMRDMRLRMLSGQPSTACQRCYDLESAGIKSHRLWANDTWRHLSHLQGQTKMDGRLSQHRLAYLDVRFSNICNLKCRTCGPNLSSVWHADHMKLYPDSRQPHVIELDGGYWDKLAPYLSQTEEVYFAGGESLVTSEHYRLLDHWLSLGMTDVRLRYTTNFTQLRYKDRHVFDLWKRFKDVRVSASIDASGRRGEYLRKNMLWEDVVENRRKMMESLPDVYFEITPTVSVFNVQHLPDLHREMIAQDLVDLDAIRINILTNPSHHSVQILPPDMKEHTRDLIGKHLNWLLLGGAKKSTMDQWQAIINHMDDRDRSELIPEFVVKTRNLDRVRSENYAATFPELRPFTRYHTICPLPWKNINTTPLGQCKLCCNISAFKVLRRDGEALNWGKHDLDEIWQGEHMRSTRQKMLDGDLVYDCGECYDLEAKGMQSPRLTALEDYGVPQTADVGQPTEFELRISTRCNLKCVTCWSGSSDKVAEERQRALDGVELPSWLETNWRRDLSWNKSDSVLDLEWSTGSDADYARSRRALLNFKKMAVGLQRLYITGGEPTMERDIHRYLDALIEAGNTECHVSWTTNGTVWNKKLMDRLRSFPNHEIQISIDAIGQANDYIRHGSSWPVISEMLERYAAYRPLKSMKVYTVLSALNCDQIPALLSWLSQIATKHGKVIGWYPIVLTQPPYMMLQQLPADFRRRCADGISAVRSTLDEKLEAEHGIDHAIGAMLAETTYRPDDRLVSWLAVNDQLRNSDWRAVFTELSDALP